jgi:cysteine synthase A
MKAIGNTPLIKLERLPEPGCAEIRAGFVPSICRMDLADEIISVSDENAIETARKLAKLEGIFGGTTSGANVWAALQRAKIIGSGKRIVTIICDTGLKYLDGDLYR